MASLSESESLMVLLIRPVLAWGKDYGLGRILPQDQTFLIRWLNDVGYLPMAIPEAVNHSGIRCN
jgi:hypothetical protein